MVEYHKSVFTPAGCRARCGYADA